MAQMAGAEYYLESQASELQPGGEEDLESQGSGLRPGAYYVGGKEAEGGWFNPAGLFDLEDGGAIEAKHFQRLHAGFGPHDREPLTRNAGIAGRSPGFDMTFSADKSISALWALSPPETRAAIERLTVAAARAALTDTVVAHCATTRLRIAGQIEIQPAEIMGATFLHRTSREEDPQLHVHCPIFNAARTKSDGKWRAHHQYPVYRWNKAAGALFRSYLAHSLQTELGLAMERYDEGGRFTRIAVGDQVRAAWNGLLAAWSKRRAQIVAAAAALGVATGDASRMQALTLATRAAKRPGQDTEADCARWRAEAEALGIDGATLRAGLPAPGAADATVLREIDAELDALPETLARREAVFTLPDIVEHIARVCAPHYGREAMDTAIQRVLHHPSIVALDTRRASPEAAAGMAHTQLFSTRATLEMEREVGAAARRLAADTTPAVPRPAVEAKLTALAAAGYPLSDEQAQAIHHLAGAGRIAIVEGAAGAGKTTTLRPLADLHRAEGRHVIPTAVAWRTALALGDDLGARPYAVDKLLRMAARGTVTLGPNCVIVVDEAGLLSTRQMHHILRLVEDTGAALVLAGDREQQQPVEAGPGLRLAAEGVGSVRVDTIRRQKADIEDVLVHRHGDDAETARLRAAMMSETAKAALLADHEASADGPAITPWQIVASDKLRTGDAAAAIEAYHMRGRFHVGRTETATLDRLVQDWRAFTRAHPEKTVAVLARTHAERRALSHLMREALLGPARAGEVAVEVAGAGGKGTTWLEIAPGDRLRIGATQWDRQLYNGSIVIVDEVRAVPAETAAGAGETGLARAEVRGHLESGRQVVFRTDEIRDYSGAVRLDHGYALTITSAQGLTVDRAFLLADAAPARETIYPAATRHRERLDIYVNRQALEHQVAEARSEDMRDAPVTDDEIRAHLARRWSRSEQKEAALDYVPPSQAARLFGGETGETVGAEAETALAPVAGNDNAVARIERTIVQRNVALRHGPEAARLADECAAVEAGYRAAGERVATEGAAALVDDGWLETLARHERLVTDAAPFRDAGRTFAALRAEHPALSRQALGALEASHQNAEAYRAWVPTISAALAEMEAERTSREAGIEIGETVQAKPRIEAGEAAHAEPRAADAEVGNDTAPKPTPAVQETTPAGDELVALKQEFAEIWRSLKAEAKAQDIHVYDHQGCAVFVGRLRRALAEAPLDEQYSAGLSRLVARYEGHVRARDAATVGSADAEAGSDTAPKTQRPAVDSGAHAATRPAPARPRLPKAAELSAALAAQAETVCRHYLPLGVKNGAYWLIGDTTGEAGRSLYVHLDGPARGKWSDGATGEYGDLLDLIRAAGGHKSMADAMGAATDFLGGRAAPAPTPRETTKTPPPVNSKGLSRLLDGGRTVAPGNAAGRYLAGRGLDPAGAGRLRYHPAAYVQVDGELRKMHALLAPVTTPEGRLEAVQRIFLDPAGRRAEIQGPKRNSGQPREGGVWFGNTGARRIAITEGVEDALAVLHVLTPEERQDIAIVASLGSGRVASVALPAGARELILVQDRDAAGETAWEALGKRHGASDIALSRIVASAKDANDDLQTLGPAGFRDTLTPLLAPRTAEARPAPTHEEATPADNKLVTLKQAISKGWRHLKAEAEAQDIHVFDHQGCASFVGHLRRALAEAPLDERYRASVGRLVANYEGHVTAREAMAGTIDSLTRRISAATQSYADLEATARAAGLAPAHMIIYVDVHEVALAILRDSRPALRAPFAASDPLRQALAPLVSTFERLRPPTVYEDHDPAERHRKADLIKREAAGIASPDAPPRERARQSIDRAVEGIVARYAPREEQQRHHRHRDKGLSLSL